MSCSCGIRDKMPERVPLRRGHGDEYPVIDFEPVTMRSKFFGYFVHAQNFTCRIHEKHGGVLRIKRCLRGLGSGLQQGDLPVQLRNTKQMRRQALEPVNGIKVLLGRRVRVEYRHNHVP
jgi:hypothetical protein